jgi:NADH-quinone oxidoreductase subunit K
MLPVFQLVGVAMFSLGFFGLVYKTSLVEMLIGMELMLNGAALSIIAAVEYTAAPAPLGQLAALLVMGLAAAESALVLAIILIVRRRFGRVETDEVSVLKG